MEIIGLFIIFVILAKFFGEDSQGQGSNIHNDAAMHQQLMHQHTMMHHHMAHSVTPDCNHHHMSVDMGCHDAGSCNCSPSCDC